MIVGFLLVRVIASQMERQLRTPVILKADVFPGQLFAQTLPAMKAKKHYNFCDEQYSKREGKKTLEILLFIRRVEVRG
jgi:hypothetical protein